MSCFRPRDRFVDRATPLTGEKTPFAVSRRYSVEGSTMHLRLNRYWIAAAMAVTMSIAIAATGISSPGRSQAASGKLVVHEWGTFLGVQGSDGTTLGGMVASEESLPAFVESRSFDTWDRISLTSKMETPVTYFYTDKPMTAHVKVDMP